MIKEKREELYERLSAISEWVYRESRSEGEIKESVEEFPELDFNWQVTFVNFTEDRAYDYMAQKNKQKPMRRDYVKARDFNKPENNVVKLITEDRLSVFGKVVKDTEEYIRKGLALTKSAIVAQAIAENYEEDIKTGAGVRNTAKWIAEFMDYLMYLYEDEFIDKPQETAKHSVINNKNMFAGYIALSAILHGDDNWQAETKKRMDVFDFNRNHPIWKGIGIAGNNNDANKSVRNKLYTIFGKEMSYNV